MRSIWSKVLREERLIAISGIDLDLPPKSSQVNNILRDLGIEKALFVLSDLNLGLVKASKNLKDIDVQTIQGINPSTLLKAPSVVVTPSTIESLSEALN